ncbi:MAG: ABC transporter ATP-binding protein/permease [Leptolyngbyaceae cyanobacterium CSU_1_4]|nr:ABC transporter ATP-binding protein/permease [Leptolyngbyaceae cyanobacterium CSU_1_4]
MLLLGLMSAALLVLVSVFLGEVTSALAAREPERFSQALIQFLGVILLGLPFLSLKTYIQAKLSLYWRKWLTDRALKQYLENQRFYQLNANLLIDNPDQRIAEDIKTLTQQSLFFIVIAFDAVLQLAAFTGVLWSISKPLMVFLILYAIVGTTVTTAVFGRSLVGINAEQLKREADFRFSLVRVRENAEAIASYQGQALESEQVWQRFLAVFHNFNHLIRWQLGLNFFQNGYQYLTFLLPALILAPAILSGQQEIGVEAQASTAFRIILLALALVIKQFEQLTALIASVDRLDCLETSTIPIPLNAPVIQMIEGDRIILDHLTLHTPDYQTVLIQDLSFRLPPGESLLIMGKSGVGKSSLLRAIAGLWQAGSGSITRPPLEKILFLPQRPYLPLGSLRHQLAYPHSPLNFTDEQLLQALEQGNLPDLSTRFGGLDAIEDWSKLLSVGEQQRLVFARLFLTQPTYAILDEATSGLDIANEKRLYEQLQKTNMTYLSVGHRSMLRNYHQAVLQLS